MQDDFTKLRVDDGTITKLCVVDADVQLHLRNWRDQMETVTFRDVIGLEAYSIVNADLSHATETESDPLLERCCAVGQEQMTEFRCYAFFSVWSEQPILKVVARSFAVENT